MAIVKLVCQGCGANLDAMDDQRVLQCGYCGTSNQIKHTVQAQAAPPPQPPPQPFQTRAQQMPPVQINVPTQSAQAGGRRVLILVLVVTLAPILLGGFITYMVFKATKDVFGDVSAKVGQAIGSAIGGANSGRRYTWNSSRPFLADVNGDGSQDVVGTIMEMGAQKLLLTAMSGSDYATLWEVELGRRADLPNAILRYEPGAKLLLFEIGPTLHAYDAATGAERWVAGLPDKIAAVALDKDQLWVATVDDEGHAVSLADGKVSDAAAKPSDSATPLRDDEKYDLIPELGELDLKTKQFDDVSVEQAFCPDHELPVVLGRRQSPASKRCANPNGIAWAVRRKGTKVPFMIGYERETKAERWRVQLTKAGSLETVDGGFGQPRAEIFGDEAIVSFTPASDDNARIRRISLTDGATKWETTLTRAHTENVNGMVVGDDAVLVAYGQSIHVLSLADGSEKAQLGGF